MSVAKYVRDLARLTRKVDDLANTPKLSHSSIDDGGAITFNDPEGNPTLILGGQYDGTTAAVPVGGAIPPQPSPAIVTEHPSSLRIYWDGSYATGAVTPMDWAKTTVHVVEDVEDFDPLNAEQIYGAIVSPLGGEVSPSLPEGIEQHVFLVSWSQAGKFSVESDPVSGTPIPTASLESVEDAVLLAQAAGDAAVTAQAAATAAHNAADAASQAAIDAEAAAAVTSAAQAEQARLDAIAEATGNAEDLAAAAEAAAKTAAAVDAQEKADAAEAAAISAAAVAAGLLYDATKSMVEGWTYTGEVTIDGGMLQADTVIAAAILAGEIKVRHLAGEVASFVDVRAQTVTAQVVKSGFVLTGEIRVGSAYWNAVSGLVIPQPDGGVISLPVDGVTPAQITAHLVAKSLTIENNLLMQGTLNKLAGTLKLANGVTAPTAPPGLSNEWPSKTTFTNTFGAIHYGVVDSLTDAGEMITATSFLGGSLAHFNKTTGVEIYKGINHSAWGGTVDFGAGTNTAYSPVGGITTLAGAYYLLGTDAARGGDWYIYKLNTAYTKVAEFKIGAAAALPVRPAIGNDGTNLLVAYGDNASTMIVRAFTTSFGNVSTRNFTGWPATIGASYIGQGSYDFGANWIVFANESGTAYVAHATTGAFQQTWNSPTGAIRGLHWDGTTFRSIDTNGQWVTYSALRANTTITAAYTWYDGDGTARETTPSPSTSFTVSARAWPRFDAPPPPDNGVAGSGVDRANRIGVYMATGANARRRQIYLPNAGAPTWQATRSYTTSSISTGGVAESTLTVNGFVGATSASPGVIQSEAGGFIVNGDGTGAWPALKTNILASRPIVGQLGLYDNSFNMIPFGGLPANSTRYNPAEWLNIAVPAGSETALIQVQADARSAANADVRWYLAANLGAGFVDRSTEYHYNNNDQYQNMNANLWAEVKVLGLSTISVRLSGVATSAVVSTRYANVRVMFRGPLP